MKTQFLKNILVMFIFCFSYINSSMAQQWGKPEDFGGSSPPIFSNFNDVCISSSIFGHIVGDGGVIYRTIDGGKNWFAGISGTTNDLHSVYFTNPDTGLVCGKNGTILRTFNRGITWETLASGTINNLNAIYLNGSFGLVGGGTTLLKTNDYGDTWTSIVYPAASNNITSISCPDKNNNSFYWVASNHYTNGSSNCFYTLNNGQSWAGGGSIGIPSGAGFNIKSIHVRNTNPTDIWIVGNPSSKKHSINNGGIWTSINMGTTTALNDIYFVNQSSTLGYAVGNNGVITKTINGGTTWSLDTTIGTQNLNAIAIKDGIGCIVGNQGTVFIYQDFGPTNIKSFSENVVFQVFPNPATNTISANLPFESKSINVFNNLGIIVLSSTSFPLNINELEEGIYYVQIFSDKNFITKKIIIKR
ncbi:MAG: T9SS type A sorting domain-containing protein [Bacteroidia bacterium]|nr:T9SS type A sorting domain-containing protein [Bacteroidia bacterium]